MRYLVRPVANTYPKSGQPDPVPDFRYFSAAFRSPISTPKATIGAAASMHTAVGTQPPISRGDSGDGLRAYEWAAVTIILFAEANDKTLG